MFSIEHQRVREGEMGFAPWLLVAIECHCRCMPLGVKGEGLGVLSISDCHPAIWLQHEV